MKKEWMYRFVAKEKSDQARIKPSMMGVYYDFREKVAVATDGYIVLISKEMYNPQYERDGEDGVSIDKDGKEIPGRYVPFRLVIPDHGSRKSQRYPLDKKEMTARIKRAKEMAKENGIKFDMVVVSVHGVWIAEKYLKAAMEVIDETIHPKNALQNTCLYGYKDGEEVLVTNCTVSDETGYNDNFVFLLKGEWQYSCEVK